jgi:superfamily II DNA helicase RecQ
MLGFLEYFGDTNDDYAPCGTCDNCLSRASKTPEAYKLKATQATEKVPTKTVGFAPGTKVVHTKYGIGTVEKSEAGSMGNRQATLRFSDGVRRVIIEKYLKEV